MRRRVFNLLATSVFSGGLLTVEGVLANPAKDLGVSFTSNVSGKNMPAIFLQPTRDVRSCTIALTRDDGKNMNLRAIDVAAGTKETLTVQQEVGTHAYDAKFDVLWKDGDKTSFTMKFSLTRSAKLELTLNKEDVDLDGRKLTFSINNPIKLAELIIVGKSGKTLKHVKRTYSTTRRNQRLELSWPDPRGDVKYMDLKVHDNSGFWKGVRLTPISISIPHDDVEFASGKWKIRKSEEPKLEATMTQIRSELAEHGTLLSLKLYIAGYTDTVGTPASNMTLSRNRARAIATWFRKNGLRLPIYYQGFGERVLAVQTPDETDEAKNRRAVYILASQIPSKSRTIPDQNWAKL